MRSVAIITVFSVLTRSIGFFFKIFLSRSLGAEMMGVYQVGFSFFILLLAITSSGVPLVVSAKSAQIPYGTKNNSIVSAGLIISATTTAALIAAVLLLRRALPFLFADGASMLVLYSLLPAVFFAAAGGSFQGAVWGKQSYLAVSASELTEQVVRVSVCVACFFFTEDLVVRARLAAGALSVATGVSAAVMFVVYCKQGGRLGRPKGELVPLIKSAAPISVMRVMSCVISSLIAIIIPNRLIAAGMDAASAMTAYGAGVGMAMSFITSPLTLTGSLSMALVPEISAALSRGHMKTVRGRVEKAISFAVVIPLLLMPVFLVLGREAGVFVYDNAASGDFLRKAAILMLPMAVEQLTSSVMNSLALERKAFRNFLIGMAALIAVIWFLPAYIGIDALIVGMFCSYTVSAVLHIFTIRKKIGLKFTFLKPMFFMFLFMLPAGAAGYLTHRIIENFAGIATVLIGAGVILSAMVLLLFCFDVVDLSGFMIKRKEKS